MDASNPTAERKGSALPVRWSGGRAYAPIDHKVELQPG
jgi:hypothetical protein